MFTPCVTIDPAKLLSWNSSSEIVAIRKEVQQGVQFFIQPPVSVVARTLVLPDSEIRVIARGNRIYEFRNRRTLAKHLIPVWLWFRSPHFLRRE